MTGVEVALLGSVLLVLGTAVLADVTSPAVSGAGHVLGSGGWVEAEPRALARGKGVSDNTYALASMMVSEAGSNEPLQLAVGWCARNQAQRRGESVFRLLTRAGRNDASGSFQPAESNGYYGPQNVGPRYASTRKEPTDGALSLADAILSDSIDDPTGGCTKFDAPSAQDSFLGKVEGYVKSAAEVYEERSKGAEIVMVPGISSTRFWRPKDTG